MLREKPIGGGVLGHGRSFPNRATGRGVGGDSTPVTAIPPSRSRADVRLRPAAAADFAFVHAARVAGLREHVARLWGWDDAAQEARFRARFDPAGYQIIVVDGQDIGALSVLWSEQEVLLVDIELLPAWHGRGLGTAIVRASIAEAHAAGLPLFLQVLRGNPARRLYERLGFRETGETESHIRMRIDPPERN